MVLKDPLGLSWQIVPRRFRKLIQDENPRKVKAVMDAMMKMVKLDVAALEKAYNEASCGLLSARTEKARSTPPP